MAQVDRLLLQLGRFYNPYVNAPIVDLETSKRIVAMLQQGDGEVGSGHGDRNPRDAGP